MVDSASFCFFDIYIFGIDFDWTRLIIVVISLIEGHLVRTLCCLVLISTKFKSEVAQLADQSCIYKQFLTPLFQNARLVFPKTGCELFHF